MTDKELFAKIDHTLLSPTATLQQIRMLCVEAMDYKCASVCIPPSYVKQVHAEFPELNICTVIGFPLGYNTTQAKITETAQAIADGANEIDMVVNITAVKNHDFDLVMDEITKIKKVCGKHILKVIVETCYLTQDEKIMLCRSVTSAGADFIKTSTGKIAVSATPEAAYVMCKAIKEYYEQTGIKKGFKAAGGINTVKDAIGYYTIVKEVLGEEWLNNKYFRLGTSRLANLLLSEIVGKEVKFF